MNSYLDKVKEKVRRARNPTNQEIQEDIERLELLEKKKALEKQLKELDGKTEQKKYPNFLGWKERQEKEKNIFEL